MTTPACMVSQKSLTKKSHCLKDSMTTLACTVSQKSLTRNFIIQNMERKKIGQIQKE